MATPTKPTTTAPSTATTTTTARMVSSAPTNTASSSKSTKFQAKRYETLQQLIQTGMTRSRQALNTTQLVEMAYGEDAAVFGGTEMLVGAMEDMLDQLHEQVLDVDVKSYLTTHDIPGLLRRFERWMAVLDAQDHASTLAEDADQTSAIQAMDTALLPAGVALEEVLAYTQYQAALTQKAALVDALERAQEEIATLESEQAAARHSMASQQQDLQRVAQDLTRSADVCSMMTS